MNVLNSNLWLGSDRELLEQEALREVCACQYYDLSAYLDITSSPELLDIICHTYDCALCGLKGSN